MKASLCMLSAAIAVCVAHAAALAQGPGGLDPWRPDMNFPPNWQPGPGGTWPYRPSGPVLPNNPFLQKNQGGWLNPVGPHGMFPREPRVSDFIDQGQRSKPNPSVPVQIPPEVLRLEGVLNNTPAPMMPVLPHYEYSKESGLPRWLWPKGSGLPHWLWLLIICAGSGAAARGARRRAE
jgi:hypothetical protein